MFLASAAASFAVNGASGFLTIIAVILFGAAAIIAWFVSPRTHWATFVAAGLCLWALASLIH
jgi:fatty acid desaturase